MDVPLSATPYSRVAACIELPPLDGFLYRQSPYRYPL